MNFFSSEEDANRLLNLAHYVPSSPHAHSSTDPLSQLTTSSQDESSLQPHYIEQQSSLAALPSTSLQGPSSGANTITMKVSESATQADTLRQAVASILSHPSPKPLAEEQSSTPRRDGSSPRKRPRSHTTYEEDSATLAPAKKQRQDATLNDISSLLLQFAQRFDKLESDMAIVKGSNSQLLQDREKGKSILPFSSSSPSEDEEDDLPPVAQSASSLPSAQPSPSPPPYLPATYSAACSLSPSPIYLPTPILNPSQGSSEERCLPASASSIQHPAPVSPMPPQPQPQTAPIAAPAAIPAEPDSPPDPAAITYYLPPGASVIFQNESEILLYWGGAGYGKFVCVDYNQGAFNAEKNHPQLSSDGLLPHSEDFQLSFEKARLDKVSPEVFTKETESSTLKRTVKALKSDSLKGLPKLSSFTELSFPNDPLFQLLTAPSAVTHEAVCDLPLSSTYYKFPSVESLAPHHLLKKDTLKHLSNHTCLHVAYQSAEFFLEKHADLLTKDAREDFTALANWLHTQQGFARDVHANLKELSFWQLRLKNEAISHQFNTSLKRSLLYKEPLSAKHLLLSEAAAMVESLPRTQLVYADKLQQPQPAAVPSTSGTLKKKPAKVQQKAARSLQEPFRSRPPSRRQGYGPSQFNSRGNSHASTSSSRPSHRYYRSRGSYGGKATRNQQQGTSDHTHRIRTQPKKPTSNFRKGYSSF
ncbi:hypothetical protein Pcinc_007766 [Petrolisthes cinctipes]|uniref:Uncharacterized protein n=1 Tax=Petrolisthes cinctipes TaxID=88211 RepID=A0AAE1G7W8_PETCI|nr:hypothetical protein Pcinc_007766 [Petrolisthes cinctipes]